MFGRKHGNVIAGAIAGAAGGLAGAAAMEVFELLASKFSSTEGHWLNHGKDATHHPPTPQRRKQESHNAPNEPATVEAAEDIAGAFGKHLSAREKPIAGEIMHYLMGAGCGAVYGAAVELNAVHPSWKSAIGFGTAVWASINEGLTPALGWSKPPSTEPPSTHVNALLTHFVYGFTTEAVRRAARSVI